MSKTEQAKGPIVYLHSPKRVYLCWPLMFLKPFPNILRFNRRDIKIAQGGLSLF